MPVSQAVHEQLLAELGAAKAELGDTKARVEQFAEQLATALATIERLTKELKRNSSNSNLPPSSDGPGAASRGARKAKKPNSKRKRGGQKGHKGARRELLDESEVSAFVELYADACEGCARALPRVADEDARRYQCIDLVRGGRDVTEFRRHAVVCPCGHTTMAPYDAELIPASPFGPRLVSVVALMTGVYHLSRRNTQAFLREVFEIRMSLGAISKLEARVSEALAPASKEAHEDVLAAMVKHTDATTWLMAGLTMSLWTLSTQLTTVFRIFKNGARATIEHMFSGADGKQTGIMVSDRASVFGFWPMELRQICWAHLLRMFVGFSQRAGPQGRFGQELLEHAALVFEYWHGFTSGALSREELRRWMDPVRRRFESLLVRIAAADIRGLSGSCANLLAHAKALWVFVEVPGVPPTNNLAERDLRSFVIWRKLSYGCQSERGLRFVERVMTVAMTLRKRARDVLDFIERSVRAHFDAAAAPAMLAA
jgi:transposase